MDTAIDQRGDHHGRWADIDGLLLRPGSLVGAGFEPGEDVKSVLHDLIHVLVVGAGGLGCELLKDLGTWGGRCGRCDFGTHSASLGRSRGSRTAEPNTTDRIQLPISHIITKKKLFISQIRPERVQNHRRDRHGHDRRFELEPAVPVYV